MELEPRPVHGLAHIYMCRREDDSRRNLRRPTPFSWRVRKPPGGPLFTTWPEAGWRAV